MTPKRHGLRTRHWCAGRTLTLTTALVSVWLGLCLAIAAPASAAAECADPPQPITLDPRIDTYFPGLNAAIAEIPPGTDGFAVMRQGTARLRPNCERHLGLPDTGADIWLTFAVAGGGSGSSWVLTVNEPQIAMITLIEALPEGSVRIKRNGADVPDPERDMALRRPVIGLAPAAEGVTRYFARISPGVVPAATLLLQPLTAYQKQETAHLIVAYAFVAFLAAIALYNLTLYVNLRLGAALVYVFYVGFIVLNTFAYEGLVLWLTPWHWPRATLDFLQEFTAMGAALSLIQYCRLLLVRSRDWPVADRITRWLMATLLVCYGVQVWDPIAYSWLLHSAYVVGVIALCVMFCRHAGQGDRTARLVSLSFMSLFVGIGLQTILYYMSPEIEPLLGATWFTGLWAVDGVFYLGISGEAVLMSIAMMVFVSEQRPLPQPVETAPTPEMEDRNRRFLAALDATIDAHIADHDLGVGSLASHMAMSERTLRRRLKEIKDATPADYIRARRLERARALIEADAYGTVAEVAHAVGLAHAGHFAKLYRQTFGSAPRDDQRLATSTETD